jgi:TPR repeat protein
MDVHEVNMTRSAQRIGHPGEVSALHWYRKSARQGDDRAMFSLGQIAYTERRDYPEALLWFRRAADKGHHLSVFWIGKLYWRGHGVKQDRQVANRYFAKAAQNKLSATGCVLQNFVGTCPQWRFTAKWIQLHS